MSIQLGWAEQEIRRQLQPFNILPDEAPDRVRLRVLASQDVVDLTFDDGWLYVATDEAWVVDALDLNVQHHLTTQKQAFSMGPHAGHMRPFWRQPKPSRCAEVAGLRQQLRMVEDEYSHCRERS